MGEVRCPTCYEPTLRPVFPEVTKTLTALALALHVVTVFPLLAAVWRRRHMFPLSKRSMLLLSLVHGGDVPIVIWHSTLLWRGHAETPCVEEAVFRYLQMGVTMGVVIARMLRFAILVRVQEQLVAKRKRTDSVTLSDDEDEVMPTFTGLARLRSWTEGWRQLWLVVVTVPPVMLPLVHVLLAAPSVTTGAVGCDEIGDEEFRVGAANWALVVFVLNIVGICWVMRRSRDAFKIRREILLTYFVQVPLSILVSVIRAADADVGEDWDLVFRPIERVIAALIQLGLPLLGTYAAALATQDHVARRAADGTVELDSDSEGARCSSRVLACCWSIQSGRKRKTLTSASRISDGGVTPSGEALAARGMRMVDLLEAAGEPAAFKHAIAADEVASMFQAHLESEFAAESLMCVREIWRLERMRRRGRLSYLQVKMFVATFITEHSVAECNIPGPLRIAVLNAADAWCAGVVKRGGKRVKGLAGLRTLSELDRAAAAGADLPSARKSESGESGDAPAVAAVAAHGAAVTTSNGADSSASPTSSTGAAATAAADAAGQDAEAALSAAQEEEAELFSALARLETELCNVMRMDSFPRFVRGNTVPASMMVFAEDVEVMSPKRQPAVSPDAAGQPTPASADTSSGDEGGGGAAPVDLPADDAISRAVG
uniref:RGS domain-containing protein n=1 Tax=Bicosoecida sp. CB-2014 TaxID=1486930 RepID=A0A7S1G9X1_9STRA